MDLTIDLPKGYEPIQLPYYNEWIKALESGEYKQCTWTLCENGKYCCLGVLSKVQGRLTRIGNKFADGKDCGSRSTVGLSLDNPSFVTLLEAGRFPQGILVYVEGKRYRSLMVMNDDGIPFSIIAQVIKQIWKA